VPGDSLIKKPAKLFGLAALLLMVAMLLTLSACGQTALAPTSTSGESPAATDEPAAAVVYELTIAPPNTPTPRPLLPGRWCGEGIVELPCGPGIELGKEYSFTLYTHCGVRRAYFDGRHWITEPELSVRNGNPPPGWGNPIDKGSMKMITENLARYTSASGAVAEFRPLAEGEEDVWSCD